ncbi:MAG: hypothetical protein WBJ21_08605 [Burkholderiaceae bacterium]
MIIPRHLHGSLPAQLDNIIYRRLAIHDADMRKMVVENMIDLDLANALTAINRGSAFLGTRIDSDAVNFKDLPDSGTVLLAYANDRSVGTFADDGSTHEKAMLYAGSQQRCRTKQRQTSERYRELLREHHNKSPLVEF